MSGRTVLMCGGPADGTWMVQPFQEREIRVIVRKPVRVVSQEEALAEGVLPEMVLYRVMPCMILGHELWVAVAVEEAYDDRVIMKAVLNRDVATQLGAYR